MEQNTKLKILEFLLIAVLLIYVSPFFSNWLNGYIGFLGQFGYHLTKILAYFIFTWGSFLALNKLLVIHH